MKRILAVIFTLVLAVGISVSAFAATYETEAGKTVTVQFSIPNSYGVDGLFEYENKSLFSTFVYSNGNTNDFEGTTYDDQVYLYLKGINTDPKTCIVNIDLTIKSSAKPGDKCNIVFYYKIADADGNVNKDDIRTITHTVVVKATETTKTPVVTNPPETTPDQPQQPDYNPGTNPPTPAAGEIDYTELLRQIAIAEGLTEDEYTKDSWDAMVKELEAARELKTSQSQDDVDAGAKALEKAIAALVKVDYSKLNKAIADAKALENCAHGPLWFKLFDALNRAEAALKVRDQKVIDDLVTEIEGIIDEIKKDCPNCGQTTEVIKEVEVLPDGEYCNIKIHKVWPILFFVSLGLNVVLAGLIIGFLLKRKKNRKDDTPLVDYDIEDDE